MSKVTISNAIALVIVVFGILGGYLAYRHFTDVAPTVQSDGKVVASIVNIKLEDVTDIRVMRLTGTAQGVAKAIRWGGIFVSQRIFKAPAEVDYFVDVSRLSRRDFFWNERDKILTIELPDVRIGSPNIDESRVIFDQTDGVFVSRGAMNELRKNSSIAAHEAARKEALKPDNLTQARKNARSMIAELFQSPLRAAGLNARVRVKFSSDADDKNERWDLTRSIEEILQSS